MLATVLVLRRGLAMAVGGAVYRLVAVFVAVSVALVAAHMQGTCNSDGSGDDEQQQLTNMTSWSTTAAWLPNEISRIGNTSRKYICLCKPAVEPASDNLDVFTICFAIALVIVSPLVAAV